MTATQVRELGRAQELPLAASDPRVNVLATLAPGESDQCCRHPLADEQDMAPEGRWEIRYCFAGGYPVRTERVCPDCSQDELQELLDWGVAQLELHLPGGWVETPPTAGDAVFNGIHECLRLVESLPNSEADELARERFEKTRNEIRARLSQLGLNRVEQLGRAS